MPWKLKITNSALWRDNKWPPLHFGAGSSEATQQFPVSDSRPCIGSLKITNSERWTQYNKYPSLIFGSDSYEASQEFPLSDLKCRALYLSEHLARQLPEVLPPRPELVKLELEWVIVWDMGLKSGHVISHDSESNSKHNGNDSIDEDSTDHGKHDSNKGYDDEAKGDVQGTGVKSNSIVAGAEGEGEDSCCSRR